MNGVPPTLTGICAGNTEFWVGALACTQDSYDKQGGCWLMPTSAAAKTESVEARIAPSSSGLRPVQPDHEVGEQRGDGQRQRLALAERPAGQPPGRAQVRPVDPHAVGDEHSEQGQLGQGRHDR